MTSSLMCYPHSLSYYNESIGGSKNGWRHLASSNVDWGQDLLYLAKWSEKHPEAKPLRLSLYGSIDPALVGIMGYTFSQDSGDTKLEQGSYAISSMVRSGFGQSDHGMKLRAEIEHIGDYETIGGSIIIVTKK